MEEIEVPTEHLHEEMHHQASGHHEAGPSWVMQVALSSALIAVMAAVSALMAGHHANEAMMDQISSSNQWSYFQAKSIKSSVMSSKIDLLKSMGKEVPEKDLEKAKEYNEDKEKISDQAKEKSESAENHMRHHVTFARGVTLFQIAIGIGAIAALTRRKKYWYVSLVFGGIGAVFLIQGFLP